MFWQIQPRRHLDLSRRGIIMGIVNVTPDSFSDGGRFATPENTIAHGMDHWNAGAEILDIGGESTRPGAPEVSLAEELARVLPVLRGLRAAAPQAILSIDTTKTEVARQAIAAGATIINDVTGLAGDPAMPELAATTGCGVVIMHMQGTPRTMQLAPAYHDVVAEVREFFATRMDQLAAAGIAPAQMVFDPGIGFGKTTAHNLELLRHLGTLAPAGRPLLLGVSRKSFIGAVLGTPDLSQRSWPTVALTSFARERGARVLRVHDTLPNVQALRMTEAILG